jgi:hypothetical protein
MRKKKKKKDVIMKRLTLCVGDHFPVACHLPFIPESLVHQGHEQCFPTPLITRPQFWSTSKAAVLGLPKWHAISLPSMPLALLSLLLQTPPVSTMSQAWSWKLHEFQLLPSKLASWWRIKTVYLEGYDFGLRMACIV